MMADDGRRGLGAPIYVLANQGNSFAETLGAAVGFQFDEHVSFRFFVKLMMRIDSMPRRDADNRLTRVMSAIERSAFTYMQLYGRPVVIVIDSVDLLQKQMPKTLDYLLVLLLLLLLLLNLLLLFYGPFSGTTRVSRCTRRELLDFLVQGKINRRRYTDHPAGRHSIQTNQCPLPPSPHIFTGRMPFLPPSQQCQSTEGN